MDRDVKNKTNRQRTKRTSLESHNRENRVTKAKVSQPLELNDKSVTHALYSKIVKQEGVDEFILTIEENTVVEPLEKIITYIRRFRWDEIDIYISKNDIAALWQQLYEHIVKGPLIVVINRDAFNIEDDPAMIDMTLHIARSMRHIGNITICERKRYISLSQMDVDEGHQFAEDFEETIRIEFTIMKLRFPTESIIRLFENAPFSKMCNITFLGHYDTYRLAISTFASTQQPVPEGVFTKLGNNDISFQLESSGARLYVSDKMNSASYNSKGYRTSVAKMK